MKFATTLFLFLACSLCFSSEAALTTLRTHSRRHLEVVVGGVERFKTSSGSHLEEDVTDGAKEETDDESDDDGDENDGDEDQEDEKAPEYETAPPSGEGEKSKTVANKPDVGEEEDIKEPANPHAKEEAKMQKQIKATELELAINIREQAEVKHKLKFFLDEPKLEEQIDAASDLVANETQSTALADMLSKMWKEMRMFEIPFYAKHMEEEQRELKSQEKKLEKKLRDEQAALTEARKRWSSGANDEQVPDAPAEKKRLRRSAPKVQIDTPTDASWMDKYANVNSYNYWTMTEE